MRGLGYVVAGGLLLASLGIVFSKRFPNALDGLGGKAAALAPTPPVTATDTPIYRWVDSKGVTHYSDNLAEVPAGQRGKAQQLNAEIAVMHFDRPAETESSSSKAAAAAARAGYVEPCVEVLNAKLDRAADPRNYTRENIRPVCECIADGYLESHTVKELEQLNEKLERHEVPADYGAWVKQRGLLCGDRAAGL